MTFPAPRPGWLLGIDTSVAQGRLDAAAIVAAGVDFAIHKATDGVHGIDPQWAMSAEASATAGLPFGAYGVLEPGSDPVAQAANYLRNVRTFAPPLAPVLDFEVAHGQTGAQALRAAVVWCREVEQALGRAPLVYTGPSFIETLERFASKAGEADVAILATYPLWIADYRHRAEPETPPPWSSWTIWQAGPAGATLPGGHGAVDVNWCRLCLPELLALGTTTPAPASP